MAGTKEKSKEGGTVTRYQAENIAIKSLENLEKGGFTLEQIAGNAEVKKSIEQFGKEYANKPEEAVKQAAEELAAKWGETESGETMEFSEAEVAEYEAGHKEGKEGEIVKLEGQSIQALTPEKREEIVKEAQEDAYWEAKGIMKERKERYGLEEAKQEKPDLSIATAAIGEKEAEKERYGEWLKQHPNITPGEVAFRTFRLEETVRGDKGQIRPEPIRPDPIAPATEVAQKKAEPKEAEKEPSAEEWALSNLEGYANLESQYREALNAYRREVSKQERGQNVHWEHAGASAEELVRLSGEMEKELKSHSAEITENLSEEKYGELLSMQSARATGSRDMLAIARGEGVAGEGEVEVAKAPEEEIKPEPARDEVAAKPAEAEKAEEKPRDKRAEELARLWEKRRSAEAAEREAKLHPEKVPAPEEKTAAPEEKRPEVAAKPKEAEEKIWTLAEIQGKIGKEPSPLTQGPEAQEAWIRKLGKLGVGLEEYRRLEAAARPKPVEAPKPEPEVAKAPEREEPAEKPMAEPRVVAGAPRETPTAEAERKKKLLAKISKGLEKSTGQIKLEAREGPDVEALKEQVESGAETEEEKSVLSGPAGGRGAGEAAEITARKKTKGAPAEKKPGMSPEERRIAAIMNAPSGLEETEIALTGRKRREMPKKETEVTVNELEGIINRRIVELPDTFRNMERFLGAYETAVNKFKEGKEGGRSPDDPGMQGWAKEAARSREKIMALLPELKNFKKMCDALREENPESPALKNAARTLQEINGLIARWEKA